MVEMKIKLVIFCLTRPGGGGGGWVGVYIASVGVCSPSRLVRLVKDRLSFTILMSHLLCLFNMFILFLIYVSVSFDLI